MQNLTKKLGVGVGLLVVWRATGWRAKRLWKALRLFEANQIAHNFMNMDRYFPSKTVRKPATAYQFARGAKIELPETFEFDGEVINTADHLVRTGLDGLLVIKNDQIVFEQYYRGHTATTRHISWSVAKSFVSALFGIAVEQGHIRSIEETVTDYLPELNGSGYENVRIKDVLQMSSGVRFDEDYGAFKSDINRFGRTIAFGGSLDHFPTTLVNERPPGTYHHYVSIDTQVLAMILRRTTGQNVTDLLEKWLWQPLGMEQDAYWVTDDKDVALALGGLNATLRDYAKFGRLYLHNGNWTGNQIVPAQWIKDSITPDAPHLQTGENDLSETPFGYGYQWWIPPESHGDYTGIGIYGQFLYIDPTQDLIIVQNASHPTYTDERETYSVKQMALFRAIGRSVADEWV